MTDEIKEQYSFDIKWLAKIYQDLLGEDYDVQINTNPNYALNKIQACIYPTRRPYKVKNINSEVIELYIEIYMPVDKMQQKDAILNYINEAINGLREGQVGYYKEDIIYIENCWTYCSTLDFSRPLMPPQVDSGKIMQLVTLMGQVLISSTMQGVMLLNEESYNLEFIEIENGVESKYSHDLRVLSSNEQVDFEPESTLMCNEEYSGVFNRTQNGAITLIILPMKMNFYKRIIMAIEKVKPFNKNQIFKLRTTYKYLDLTTEQDLILTSISKTGNAGAFTQLSLSFMPASSVLEEVDG